MNDGDPQPPPDAGDSHESGSEAAERFADGETADQQAAAGSMLRIAALVATVAVVAAAVLIISFSGDEPKPQSIVPVTPEPKSLSAAGFTKQDDGSFAPEGFGMTFDYPGDFFEMLSPEGESSRDDETLGISERRRHFLFPDSASNATADADAQPAFRMIRVTYTESFDAKKLAEFRTNLAGQPGSEPTEITEVGGVPSFSRDYEAPGGEGETTYFAAGGKLYQLISFADRDDKKSVAQAREQILATLSFDQ